MYVSVFFSSMHVEQFLSLYYCCVWEGDYKVDTSVVYLKAFNLVYVDKKQLVKHQSLLFQE